MTSKLKAGAGGNWKRLDEKFDKTVVKQINDFSCVAAVGEMLAEHYDLNIKQEEILGAIGELSNAFALAIYLNKVDKSNGKWLGGNFPPMIEFIEGITGSIKVWAVILREGNTLGHAVLIDGSDEHGLVKIKDPFDQTSYKMTVKDLFEVLSEFVVKRK
jgi:hypothetical protein